MIMKSNKHKRSTGNRKLLLFCGKSLIATRIKLVVQMCDVAAGKSEDFDLAQLAIRRLRRNKQPQCVEGHIDAAWKP